MEQESSFLEIGDRRLNIRDAYIYNRQWELYFTSIMIHNPADNDPLNDSKINK